MATRTKTVEFVADTITSSLASNTNRAATIDIYIPEGSRTFTSCVVECGVYNDGTTQFDDPVLGISTDGVTFSETTLGDQPTSNEVDWHLLRADVTAYFESNFNGATPPTSATWSVRFRAPNDLSSAHTFKLIITYDYDDTDTTHIKTVRIPIESTLTSLTTSYQNLGGSTPVPDIEGSYLPEDSPVIRQAWLEVYANSGSVTSLTSTIRFDSTEYIWCVTNSTNSSWAQHMYGIADVTAADFSTAKALEIKSDINSTVIAPCAVLCVTYEFDASATTTVLNSLKLGVPGLDVKGMNTTFTNSAAVKINIQEASPALLQSAFFGRTEYDDVIVLLGSQTATEYTLVGGTTSTAGDFTFMHRFDSAAAKSAGYTLSVGENTFELTWYPDDTSGSASYQTISGYLIVNYTSSTSSNGVGTHNHTVFSHLRDSAATLASTFSAAGTLGESEYFINSLMSEVPFHSMQRYYASLQPLRSGGEGVNQYVRSAISYSAQVLHGEASTRVLYLDHTHQFRQFPDDPRPELLDLMTSRNWRFVYSSSLVPSDTVGLWTTYHSITYQIDIALSGYTATGDGVTVTIYRLDTDEVAAIATTATGGTATAYVYDSTASYRGVAQQGVLSGASLEVSV